MRDAIEVANRRAPEHLQIVAEGAERVAAAIRHAGAIFLGDDTPEPVGDYLAGPSHVLPTGGHRAVRFAPRRVRLREANQRHPVHPGPAGRRRRGDHRAGRGGGTVRARGGGADPAGGGCGLGAADRGVTIERRRPFGQAYISPWLHVTSRADCAHLTRGPATPLPRLWVVLGLTGHLHGARGRRADGSAARWRCWPMRDTC